MTDTLYVPENSIIKHKSKVCETTDGIYVVPQDGTYEISGSIKIKYETSPDVSEKPE